jgi:hypothetical protein
MKNFLLKITHIAELQWVIHVILATWQAKIGKVGVQGQPRQIVQETPISKITRAKWTGGVAQAEECLLCKNKALSSSSQSHQKKINMHI